MPPNNSNEPAPNADTIIPNKGKQQGDVMAVKIMPITPIFSIMLLLITIRF